MCRGDNGARRKYIIQSVLFMPFSDPLCGYCIVKNPSTARFNFCPPKLSLKLVTFFCFVIRVDVVVERKISLHEM